MSAAEAALTSVEDMLKLLDKDRTEILAQATKAGFVAPEKPGVLEYEVEPDKPELLPDDHPQVQELAKLVDKQQKILAGQREAGISGMDLNETVLDLANMKRAWQLFREGKQERDVFKELMNQYPEIAEIFKEKPPEKPTEAIAYSSGASRINDLKAHIDEGWPVGVSVVELTEPATKELESLAGGRFGG
jgi:hypothetical protein